MTTTRLCKYHGRACEYPGHCLNRAPRKYEGDGHMETIDPERLIIGCVLRMPYDSGSIHTFSDSVVTGIRVNYKKMGTRASAYGQGHEDKWCDNLLEALDFAKTVDGYVVVKVSRPYLYAHNIGGGMPNWLVGVDTHEVDGKRLNEQHKVVVQSTGEYANHNAWEAPTKHE